MLMRSGFCSYCVTLTADKLNFDLLPPQERWGASCSCAMTVLHGRLVPNFHMRPTVVTALHSIDDATVCKMMRIPVVFGNRRACCPM